MSPDVIEQLGQTVRVQILGSGGQTAVLPQAQEPVPLVLWTSYHIFRANHRRRAVVRTNTLHANQLAGDAFSEREPFTSQFSVRFEDVSDLVVRAPREVERGGSPAG